MKYRIYNDIHCGSSIELMGNKKFLDLVLEDELMENGIPIYLGDNLDLAGCSKDMVEELVQDYLYHQRLFANRFIDGNHERMTIVPSYYIDEGVIFSHGDFEKWGDKKAIKYRSKSHGASKFKQKFIIPTIEWAEQFGVNRATKKFKKAAAQLAKENSCHTYVCGHIHPKEKLDFIFDDIRIIVLPRGVNFLKI